MSIVYDDIQAVTRLLAEKEKVDFNLSIFLICEKLTPEIVVGFRADRSHWKRAFNTEQPVGKEGRRARC